MKKFWNWITVSSANPQATSLTVKGFLLALLPVFMVISPLDEATLNSTVGLLAQAVEIGLGIVSGGVILFHRATPLFP